MLNYLIVIKFVICYYGGFKENFVVKIVSGLIYI